MQCTLCGNIRNSLIYSEENTSKNERYYYRCSECDLIFVPSCCHIEPEEEKKRYDQHENDSADERYRAFLNRVFKPMVMRLEPAGYGLDFGSGPGPTLNIMFEEAGHKMNIFDIYYANNQHVFSEKYDFITATEVLEHLSKPGYELKRLWNCLKPGGYLGIMTKFSSDNNHFSTWHYKNDDTHIAFYSKATFKWLGYKWNTIPEFFGSDTVLFQKP